MCIFISPFKIDQLSREKMVDYKVKVFTSNRIDSTTLNKVFIKLVGTDGESERQWLKSLKGAAAFVKGAVSVEDQAQSLNVSNVSSVLLHMNIHKLSLMFINKICAA